MANDIHQNAVYKFKSYLDNLGKMGFPADTDGAVRELVKYVQREVYDRGLSQLVGTNTFKSIQNWDGTKLSGKWVLLGSESAYAVFKDGNKILLLDSYGKGLFQLFGTNTFKSIQLWDGSMLDGKWVLLGSESAELVFKHGNKILLVDNYGKGLILELWE